MTGRPPSLERWSEARQLAPELEEVAFWQALVLADDGGEMQGAAALLSEMLAGEPNPKSCIDLVRRPGTGGYIERPGVAEALLARVNSATDL